MIEVDQPFKSSLDGISCASSLGKNFGLMGHKFMNRISLDEEVVMIIMNLQNGISSVSAACDDLSRG